MNSIRRFGVYALLVATVASLSACDSMSRRQRDTAIGAGVGGVAGAAIGGNALSTLGGAAAGGLIVNPVAKYAGPPRAARCAARFSFDQTAFPHCGSAVFASGAGNARK